MSWPSRGGVEPLHAFKYGPCLQTEAACDCPPASLLANGKLGAISSWQAQAQTALQVFSGCSLSLRFVELFSFGYFSDLYRP